MRFNLSIKNINYHTGQSVTYNRIPSPLSSETIKALYFLPVGPKTQGPFLADTVDSIRCFKSPASRILIFDDGATCDIAPLAGTDPMIRIMRSERRQQDAVYDSRGIFWVRQARCWAELLKNEDFDVLIRLDDDSAVIGSEPEQDAAVVFRADSSCALLGQYRRMPDGRDVSLDWPARQIRRECTWNWVIKGRRQVLVRWRWRRRLRRLVHSALAAGWTIGEHVTGGGYFIKRSALAALADCELLPAGECAASELADDHLLSLCVAAAGLGIGDCAGPQGIVAYRLDRFPFPPDEVGKRPAKIIHSVRRQVIEEAEVRVALAAKRKAVTGRFDVGT